MLLYQRIMTKGELQYLAGFFDGEGSVGLYYSKSKKAWKAQIEIVQVVTRRVEKDFSDWAQHFDGNVYIQKRNGFQTTVRLTIRSRHSLLHFIDALVPYTKFKTQQLRLIRNWLDGKDYSYRTAQLLRTLKRPA